MVGSACNVGRVWTRNMDGFECFFLPLVSTFSNGSLQSRLWLVLMFVLQELARAGQLASIVYLSEGNSGASTWMRIRISYAIKSNIAITLFGCRPIPRLTWLLDRKGNKDTKFRLARGVLSEPNSSKEQWRGGATTG